MKILNIGLLILVSLVATAQIDRTKAPLPGPAPEIKLGKAQSFSLKNGLKVFVVENHKLPRVAFSLSLDQTPIIEGNNAGYVSMTGKLMQRGTTKRTKEQLDNDVDFLGASLQTSPRGIFASSLTKHKEKLLELMTDVLYNPSFPKSELDKLKKQTISELAQSKENPDAIAANVNDALVYGKNHPYGEVVTETTVEKITVEDCKNYYKTYFKPNRAYMAIVGDITFKEAKKLIKTHFSKWKKGEVKQATYTMPKAPSKTYVAMVDKPSSVQSVINISYPIILPIGHPDVIKANVMNQILGGGFSSRLSQNIREDKAFTYGANSSISSDRLVGSFTASASVRNEVTDSAVHEFLYELERIKKEKVTQKELKAAKAYIMGGFGRALERPETVASFAINTAVHNLPDDYYSSYLKKLEAVTLDDIKAMATKYIKPKNAHIVIVGKAKDVASKLKRFGEVKYFDFYGNNYQPSAAAKVPSGMTAYKVIDKYIEALGGKENISKIKNVTSKFEANMMGQKFKFTQISTSDFKSKTSAEMQGMKVMEAVSDGTKVKASQMNQMGQLETMPMEEADIEDEIVGKALFAELHFKNKNAKLKLDGIEKKDGKDNYVVVVTLPKGSEFTNYYDVKTGLKSGKSMTFEDEQGAFTEEVKFQDYKKINNVNFPHTIIQNMGPQEMRMEATSIEVNTDINDDLFSVK